MLTGRCRHRFFLSRFFFISVFIFFLFTATDNVAAQDPESKPEPETILIRNVRLIDSTGKAEDRVVNIFIKDKQLEIVTMEELSDSQADLILDAENSFLMGHLNVGKPPSFMIIDEDPRENFEVLLDTDTYARFAIYKGEIVRNYLATFTTPRIEADDHSQERYEETKWFAYTPPPLALPVSYQGGAKWNQWEGNYVSGIFLAAAILDRQLWMHQDDDSEQQVGDLEEYEGGEIRGLRVGLVGTFNFPKPWVYTVFAATNAFDKGYGDNEIEDISVLDFRLDIPLYGQTALAIGKQKESISMERLTTLVYLPMQERYAAADAFLQSRNTGVVLSGFAFDQRMTWAGGVFNDWIDADQSISDNANQVIGRITYLPLLSGNEQNLLHLGLGFRYSDAKEGMRFKADPEFDQAPIFVDTGFMDADNVTSYNAEVSWLTGPFWVGGEYIRTYVDAPELGNPVFNGYNLSASWVITGEMRPYNRKSGIINRYPVAKSVYQGGIGAWEAAVRWSNLDLTDSSVEGGEMDILSLGLNWWLTSYFSASVNYRHIILDRYGTRGTSDGVNIRVVLLLE
jgi:phosphate-selective porin OprO/OprP